MAELLIKIGDNFPHKDLMLSLATTDVDAKQYWIERQAELSLKETIDERIAEATSLWAENCRAGHRQGDIIKVRRDGWDWGNRESFPRFHIARIKDSELDLIGYRFSGPKDQEQIAELAGEYFTDKFKEEYYHRHKFYLPDITNLKPDKTIEISPSLIIAREKGYEPYDPAKASIHASAGTYTIKSSGGSYTDLSGWEAGEQCDLTGNGLCIAECYNDWVGGLDDAVVLAGWTVTSNDYLKIYSPSGERHSGKWETTAFHLDYSGISTIIITVDTSYTKIDGLQIHHQNDASTISRLIGTMSSSVGLEISHCICNAPQNGNGIYFFNSSVTAKIWNTVVWHPGTQGSSSEGIYADAVSTLEIYNCVVCNFNDGIERDSGTVTVKNTACFNNGDDFDGTMTIDHCASDDGDGTNSVQPTDWSAVFEDYANGDFHLKSTDTDLKDAGTNDPGNGLYSDDINYITRTGTWDIGADEYVAAEGISIPVVDHHLQQHWRA